MATYAYRDDSRKTIIYAANAVTEDRDEVFFCPNPDCTAHLYICAIDGSRKAYFRASSPEFRHVPNCPFGASNDEFDADQFDETKFVFESAVDSLCTVIAVQKTRVTPGKHCEGAVKKHPPRTLRQIYMMCKSCPVTETYGDKEIGEMLLDDRSEYRYPKGCFGNRIIEARAKGKLYNNIKKQIYLTAPMNSNKYSFTLQFTDSKTYNTIRNEIYNNRDKIIVVVGKWESSGTYNHFTAKIIGRKQITVIK